MVDNAQRPDVPQVHADEREHRRLLAIRANASLPKDATQGMAAPLLLMQYATADLPTASLYPGAVAYDTDLDALVYSNGTSWNTLAPSYSTGSWTPTLATDGVAFTSVTYDGSVSGYYTKVGDLVYITGFMRTDAITKGAATGNIVVGGLPFTSFTDAGTGDHQSISIGEALAWTTNHPVECKIPSSSTTIELYYRATANGASVRIAVADVAVGANSNSLLFAGSYKVA